MLSDLKIENGELAIENNELKELEIIDKEYQYLKNMFLYPNGSFKYFGKDLGYLHLFESVNLNDPNSFLILLEDIQRFLETRNKFYKVKGFMSDGKKVFEFSSYNSAQIHQLIIEE